MSRNDVINAYFDWLVDVVNADQSSKQVSYKKLLTYLHSVEFVWNRRIIGDANRARDGEKLRHRFGTDFMSIRVVDQYITGPCSVLEMIVALAIRCEETIMDDPLYGDRTCQWFWGMINNLGLGDMYDENFDEKKVHDIVVKFINRDYKPNGKGGLFTIRYCEEDLRDVEIWTQLCWYLDSIS